MSILVPVKTKAPTAVMHKDVAPLFDELRRRVRLGSGVDFLAVCGDVTRPANFVSSKDGVANRSWHKTGRAFDYDQTNKALIVIGEPKNGKQYFRSYLLCAVQDGTLGTKRLLRHYNGGSSNAYVFDFTAAAEEIGFSRIPAWSGWRWKYNRREFWHYEKRDGLTWDAAMLQLRGKIREPEKRVLGLNDRGDDVSIVQRALNAIGLLPADEIDGIYGSITKGAVEMFQRQKGLPVDGLVGPNTRAKLGI